MNNRDSVRRKLQVQLVPQTGDIVLLVDETGRMDVAQVWVFVKKSSFTSVCVCVLMCCSCSVLLFPCCLQSNLGLGYRKGGAY